GLVHRALAFEPWHDLLPRDFGGLVEVLPRAECALARAGQDQRADAGIGVERAQRVDERLAQRAIHGVHARGAVQYDDGDIAVAFDAHHVMAVLLWIAHDQVSSCSWTTASTATTPSPAA